MITQSHIKEINYQCFAIDVQGKQQKMIMGDIKSVRKSARENSIEISPQYKLRNEYNKYIEEILT